MPQIKKRSDEKAQSMPENCIELGYTRTNIKEKK